MFFSDCSTKQRFTQVPPDKFNRVLALRYYSGICEITMPIIVAARYFSADVSSWPEPTIHCPAAKGPESGANRKCSMRLDRERLAHGPPISRAVEDGVRAVVENHKIAARDQRKILYLVTWQRDLDATRDAADNESDATTNLMQWREEC